MNVQTTPGSITVAVQATTTLLDAAETLSRSGHWTPSHAVRREVAIVVKQAFRRLVGRKPSLAQFRLLDALMNLDPSFGRLLGEAGLDGATPRLLSDAQRHDADLDDQLAWTVVDAVRALGRAILGQRPDDTDAEQELQAWIEELCAAGLVSIPATVR